MTYPVVPVVRPADMLGVTNGELPANLLKAVGTGGMLHHYAARAWLALTAAALTDGHQLTYTYGGCYRTYSQQEALFRARYSITPIPGRPTKIWNGQTWYQRPGVAVAAVPGTSNHGLGLAVDAACGDDPTRAMPLSSKALDWLLDHAAAYGFSWELQSEPWHIRYVAGDRTPPALVKPEPPEPPQPPVEDVDMVRIAACDNPSDGKARAEALTTIGADGKPRMVGFDTTAQRSAWVKLGATRVSLTAEEYDGLLAMVPK